MFTRAFDRVDTFRRCKGAASARDVSFFVILFDGTTRVGNTSSARIEAIRLVFHGQMSPCKHVSSPSDVSRRPEAVAHDLRSFPVFFFHHGMLKLCRWHESTPPARFVAVNSRHLYTANRRAIDSTPLDGREGAADGRFVAKTVGAGRGVIDISAHTRLRPGDT